MSAYWVIRVKDGYYLAGRSVPVDRMSNATRWDNAPEARGVASGTMPDHNFGCFMTGFPGTMPEVVKVKTSLLGGKR